MWRFWKVYSNSGSSGSSGSSKLQRLPKKVAKSDYLRYLLEVGSGKDGIRWRLTRDEIQGSILFSYDEGMSAYYWTKNYNY